jgi:archaellum biogenesis protein FlaJ (TadC family)
VSAASVILLYSFTVVVFVHTCFSLLYSVNILLCYPAVVFIWVLLLASIYRAAQQDRKLLSAESWLDMDNKK